MFDRLLRLLRAIRHAVREEQQPSSRERVFVPPPPEHKAPRVRPWTGEGSRTESNILYHLQYGPMTRAELDAVLDVQTAGIYLPLMVRRGQVCVDRSRRPFVYSAVAAKGGR